MRKFVLFILCIFVVGTAKSATSLSVNDGQITSLVDSFSVALVKKDKAWMQANLSDACKMYEPTGNTLNKSTIIMAFTQGVYAISKSEALNKSIKINGAQADVSADLRVEGMGNVNGSEMDISNTYRLDLKFVQVDNNWKISEITISQ